MMPRPERQAVLAAAAALAEKDYRDDKELTGFDAFSQEEVDDDEGVEENVREDSEQRRSREHAESPLQRSRVQHDHHRQDGEDSTYDVGGHDGEAVADELISS